MDEVKIRYAMMAFGLMIPLLFSQLSCATVEKNPAEEPSVAAEAGAGAAGLLADIHDSAGITCSECHAEAPPASAVPKDACLTCHADYQELTASLYGDPHNGHMTFPDCGNCHHNHQQGENQCVMCHAL